MRVAPGDRCLAIVGPTGSGKTTLLRTLLGLDAAVAGEALVYGGASHRGARVRPCVASVRVGPPGRAAPRRYARGEYRRSRRARAIRPPRWTPIGARIACVSAGDARARPRRPRALSGGERQWVALARAVATRLPVLLLDEPTSGLDGAAQARVLEAIARLKGQRTVILVTHREEPLAIADVVLRLDALEGPASAWPEPRAAA